MILVERNLPNMSIFLYVFHSNCFHYTTLVYKPLLIEEFKPRNKKALFQLLYGINLFHKLSLYIRKKLMFINSCVNCHTPYVIARQTSHFLLSKEQTCVL